MCFLNLLILNITFPNQISDLRKANQNVFWKACLAKIYWKACLAKIYLIKKSNNSLKFVVADKTQEITISGKSKQTGLEKLPPKYFSI